MGRGWMSEYYRLNPARWIEGVAVLNDEQELAYFRIINWTHLFDEPPLDDDKVIARALRTGRKRARRLVVELVERKKLFIQAGRIHNKRADDEIQYRKTLSETRSRVAKGAKIPKISSENDRNSLGIHSDSEQNPQKNEGGLNDKPLNSNGAAQANAPYKNRIEENRESYLGSAPASPAPTKVKKGSRLSDDWRPSPDDLEIGLNLGFSQKEILDQFNRFRDYWRAKPGANATSTNWSLNFRNWLRKAHDDQRNRRTS
jgi:uncharacterized protein YdaU (DUF1376 family)